MTAVISVTTGDPTTLRPPTKHDYALAMIAWGAVLFVAGLFFYAEHEFWRVTDGWGTGSDYFSVGEAASGVAAGQASRRAAYVAFGLFGLLSLWKRRVVEVDFRNLGLLLAGAFVLWSCTSLLWTGSFVLSARRVPGLLIILLGVYAIHTRWWPRQTIALLLLMTLGYLLIGVFAEMAHGAFQPFGGRFSGTLSPTSQGLQCGTLVLLAAWLSGERRARWLRVVAYAVAVLAVLFLLLTRTRSAVAATLVALVLLALLQRRLLLLSMAVLGGVAAFTTGAILSVNGAFPNAVSVLALGRSLEHASTLTGRIPLWEALMGFVAERPVLGYGYGAFMDPTRGALVAREVGAWAFGGPHNVYVGIALDLGLVGLSLFVGMIALSVGRVVLRRDRPPALHSLFACIVILYSLYGMFDAVWTYPRPDFIGWLALGYLLLVPLPRRSLVHTGFEPSGYSSPPRSLASKPA